jgi:23S rRNA pseudouridine955/2504/2580 synthase
MREIVVAGSDAGGRADKYLLKYLNLAPKSFVYKMLRKKNITLNGGRAVGGEILKEGDRLRFFIADATLDKFTAIKIAASTAREPDVVYDDANILVCNKPRGVLAHPRKAGERNAMTDMALAYLRKSGFDLSGPFAPAFVNRLDMNTSGVMTCGKTPKAIRWLSKAVADGKAEKRYVAIVVGSIEKGGEIRFFHVKNKNDKRAELLGEKSENAKETLTVYKPIECVKGFTLVEITLKTGKFHQIRAHFKAIGHPVAGDVKYGDARINKLLYNQFGIKFQMLHALSVEYTEREGDLGYIAEKRFTAPPPPEFLNTLKALGFTRTC